MHLKYRQRSFTIYGLTKEDHIYKEIARKGAFYEMDLLEYVFGLRSFLDREDSITIDVGANIGNHSIFFRSFLTDHLISVEPNPQLLPVLRANLERNIDNFTIYPLALGAEAGKGRLFLPEDSGGDLGMVKIQREDDPGGVDIITLDTMMEDWLQKHPQDSRVTLIKVDVEGMELEVLQGAQKTIEKYKPHLLLEAQTESDARKLIAYLERLGYVDLSHWTSTPVYHFCHQPSARLRMSAYIAIIKSLILERFIRRAARLLRRLLT